MSFHFDPTFIQGNGEIFWHGRKESRMLNTYYHQHFHKCILTYNKWEREQLIVKLWLCNLTCTDVRARFSKPRHIPGFKGCKRKLSIVTIGRQMVFVICRKLFCSSITMHLKGNISNQFVLLSRLKICNHWKDGQEPFDEIERRMTVFYTDEILSSKG